MNWIDGSKVHLGYILCSVEFLCEKKRLSLDGISEIKHRYVEKTYVLLERKAVRQTLMVKRGNFMRDK